MSKIKSINNNLYGIVLLCCLCLSFGGDCWGHKLEVQVMSFSQVPANTPVRLGFISTPVSADPDDMFENIQDIEIFDPRAAGDKQFLGRVEIVRALQDKVSSDEVTFKIPNQMILETKKNMIIKTDVQRALVRAVQQQCGDCRIELRDLRIPELKGAQEDLTSWSLDTAQTKLQGSFLAPLKVQFPSGEQGFYVTGTIDIYKSGLVLRRSVPAGERLRDEDFERKSVNVTFLKGSLLSEAEVKGQVLARPSVSGQVLVSGDVKREPAANRGQLMKVIAGDENLEVILQATAEESGFVGDLIKLRNTETQKFISGKILDKGVVKLQ